MNKKKTNRFYKRNQQGYQKGERLDRCRVVLSLLLKKEDENLYFRELFKLTKKIGKERKQTGFENKNYLEEALLEIEKMNLVERIKETKYLQQNRGKKNGKKAHKQKIIILLTDLGKDVAKLIKNLEDYNINYFNYINALSNKVLFVDQDMLTLVETDPNTNNVSEQVREDVIAIRARLINRGWNKEELCFYNIIRNNLLLLKNILNNNLFNIFLIRYTHILLKYRIKNELLLSKFMNYLIKNIIGSKIDYAIQNYDKEIYGYSTIDTKYPYNIIRKNTKDGSGGNQQFFDSLYDIFDKNIITFAMKNEISNAVISYLEMIEFPLAFDSYHPIEKNYEAKENRYILNFWPINFTILELKDRYNSNDLIQPIEKHYIELTIKTMEFLKDIVEKYATNNDVKVDVIL